MLKGRKIEDLDLLGSLGGLWPHGPVTRLKCRLFEEALLEGDQLIHKTRGVRKRCFGARADPSLG